MQLDDGHLVDGRQEAHENRIGIATQLLLTIRAALRNDRKWVVIPQCLFC
jgi:hypothetical protein